MLCFFSFYCFNSQDLTAYIACPFHNIVVAVIGGRASVKRRLRKYSKITVGDYMGFQLFSRVCKRLLVTITPSCMVAFFGKSRRHRRRETKAQRKKRLPSRILCKILLENAHIFGIFSAKSLTTFAVECKIVSYAVDFRLPRKYKERFCSLEEIS